MHRTLGQAGPHHHAHAHTAQPPASPTRRVLHRLRATHTGSGPPTILHSNTFACRPSLWCACTTQSFQCLLTKAGAAGTDSRKVRNKPLPRTRQTVGKVTDLQRAGTGSHRQSIFAGGCRIGARQQALTNKLAQSGFQRRSHLATLKMAQNHPPWPR